MANYLVTGGCGFIGSNVANRLLKDGHRAILFDNLSRPNVVKNLMWLISNNNRIKFLQYDVRDAERVKQVVNDFDIDVIFHFAAQVGVTTSIENPRHDFEVNALGTFNVLEAARLSGKKPQIIFASTNKVYGDFETDESVSEKQPLSFCTPYGCSKGAGEQYVLDYHKIYGLPTTVLRMSCIYGQRQFGTEEQGWLAHFMFSKKEKKPITIYGDGNQVRDVLYIDDYVDLCLSLVENKDKVVGEVFNIGGGRDNQISVIDAVKRIGNEYSFADWRPNDQHFYVSNLEKINKFIGWSPQIGIEEGLERLKKWTENPR